MEKQRSSIDKDNLANFNQESAEEQYIGVGTSRPHADRGFVQRCVDSFRPPTAEASSPSAEPGDEKQGLKRELKERHMQMIAIGGAIGTGLFVGSGGSLVAGGPASVVIAFILIGTMLFNVVHALGELAVLFPVEGSFAMYSTRFLDPAWGFAMGWNYALQWLAILPLELSAASIVVRFWPSSIPLSVYITIFLIMIICINLCGVRGYGEAEFIFSSIKVIAVVGFIILAILINVGATPSGKYLGAKTWSDPGAFRNGIHGLSGVFVNAAFAFCGTELVGLAAAEAADPRKTLPKATKQVFWRITIFYVLSLFLVGLIVPYNDPRLTKGASKAARSPFVIAIQIGGVKTLPDIFNFIILVAVISVGNAATYGSSRTIAALAKVGQAPKFLGYIDRKGRPLPALALALVFGLLGYVNASPHGSDIFNWLLAISSLSSFASWGSICLCHIRFRKAWRVQGHTLEEIPFRAAGGVYGSWFGFIFNILCLVATFYVSVWPVGNGGKVGTINDFFINYLAVPVIIAFYICYKVVRWNSASIVRSATMDITSNRRSLNVAQLETERIYAAENPVSGWKKLWNAVC